MSTDHDWHDAFPQTKLPPQGCGTLTIIRNHAIAVFHLPDGSLRAIDNRCPHAGGSLAGGEVDTTSVPGHTCVVCPWHSWMFDLDTGQCPGHPVRMWHVKTYPVRIINGIVQVRLPPTPEVPQPD